MSHLFQNLFVLIALFSFSLAYGDNYVDLSEEDEKRVFGVFTESESNIGIVSQLLPNSVFTNFDGLPRSVSLEKEFPSSVKNQNPRPSCSVFAAIALAEYASYEVLSEQCLAYLSSNKDPGTISQRVRWILNHGVYNEAQCGYNGFNRDDIPNDIGTHSKVRISAELNTFAPNLRLKPNSTYIRSELAKNRPVGISLFLPGSWWKDSVDTSRLDIPSENEIHQWRNSNCEEQSTGKNKTCDSHALVVTAYDDLTQTFVVRNSWGDQWKEQGYGRISYNYVNRFHTSNEMVSLESRTPYRFFSFQTGTPILPVVDQAEMFVNKKRDVFFVHKRNTGTGKTEVHVLTAKSGYQTYSLHVPTCLNQTGNNFQFCLAPNDDLFAIAKSGTGSKKTEVHVLSAAKGYNQFSLQVGTCLKETGDNFQFCLAPNRDLYAINMSGTGTGYTEIHVLSAKSDYQKFSLQTTTCLHETGPNFKFLVDEDRNVVGIKRSGTRTNSTEVYKLSAKDDYHSFCNHLRTRLHETDHNFDFGIAENGDVFVFKSGQTGTGSTEVHILKN